MKSIDRPKFVNYQFKGNKKGFEILYRFEYRAIWLDSFIFFEVKWDWFLVFRVFEVNYLKLRRQKADRCLSYILRHYWDILILILFYPPILVKKGPTSKSNISNTIKKTEQEKIPYLYIPFCSLFYVDSKYIYVLLVRISYWGDNTDLVFRVWAR